MSKAPHPKNKPVNPSARRATPAPALETRPRGLPAPLERVLLIGVVLLFIGACFYGVLEVHSSTDTWIGLAAGRQIAERGWGDFPKQDTFSYTSGGTTWYNQNWLSHLYFWMLYHHLGRSALIYGTWLISFGTFTCVLLATWLRCGSWIAATLAAALVAISCRDWVSIRPATIQFFCMALAWLALSGLLVGSPRHRWWPLVVLGVNFLVWPHVHGSFVFGYGLVGMFVVTGLAGWLLQRRMAVSVPQMAVLLAVAAVTAILGAALSPYGVENYLHPTKVAESKAFRTVGEWLPPYISGKFPPVLRFWLALGVAATSVLAAAVLRLFGSRGPTTTGPAPAPQPPASLHAHLFDIGALILGLGMALFARRFAPIFYILATPALVTWIIRLASPGEALRRDLRQAFALAAWPALAVTLFVTSLNAKRELRTDFPGEWDLLDRITQNMRSPHEAFEWLNRNDIDPRVMTEWKVAGTMMFYVPGAQVYIDGRAQQVYSEAQYNSYLQLQTAQPSQAGNLTRMLLDAGTEMVLLPNFSNMERLQRAIESQPVWHPVYESMTGTIWVNRESPLARSLLEREERGDLWWPDDPRLLVLRGRLLAWRPEANLPRAIELWQEATRRDVRQGLDTFFLLTQAWKHQGRADLAAAFLAEQRRSLTTADTQLPQKLRDKLLEILQRCEALLADGPRTP